MGRGDMVHPKAFGVVVNQAEKAVIRAYEIITFRHGYDRPPAAPYAGINDGEVNRPFWEMTVRGLQDVCRFPDVLRRYFIRDIDDLSLRVDLEDDALYARRKEVPRPEIGCQRNNGGHQSPGMNFRLKTARIISILVCFVNLFRD